jgi:lipoate-protein ligase A
MHGEHKTPGGKLVVVDFDVRDERLAGVRVSGDFFLYPDEALHRITAALEGAPADASETLLAERVRAALPEGAELLGTSPEAIGKAVRGARRNAILDGWLGRGWQLIPETPLAAALNLALDDVLLRRVAEGRRGPTLRFWGWAEPAVVIGRFQSVRNEVDGEEARRRGVTVVRRMSGGGAMLVQPGLTVTYSLYLPEPFVAGLSIAESYELCDSWVVDAFNGLGVQARYVPLNDISSPEGKIGGAAQARRPGVVLHHTTIAYEMSADEMVSLLRIGREKLSDKGIPSAAKRVSPLRRQTDLSREAIVERLVAGFRDRFGLTEGGWTDDEWAEAQRLARDQYGSDAWTHTLP